MSGEQLSALLAKLKEDGEFQKLLMEADNLDAAAEMVRKAGFDVSVAELRAYLGEGTTLTDRELESIAGGQQTPMCETAEGCCWGDTCTRGNDSCKKNTIGNTPYRLDC